MPTYVYEILDDDGEAVGMFEVIQAFSEAPLTTHPETGQKVQRVIQPPFIGGTWSESHMHKSSRDDKKLEQLGFTKYVKAGDGIYEKRAGKGPRTISKDAPITAKDLKGKGRND
jgi:predicted nucleic acid-binding Zn ribbon protein